jgi:two-component system chemotaxis response regulator CheB
MPTRPQTRVLVVEDSLTVRKHIVEILAADPDLVVVGEAGDGPEAIEKCRSLRPDVLTLDMILPTMTGLQVTEHVMAFQPTPILIVSSSINRGELYKTYDALAAGAVDVFDKANADSSDLPWAKELVSRLKMVSRIKVITHLRGKLGQQARAPITPQHTAAPARRRVVAIGASTGGPSAVLQILRALPGDYPIPLLVLIHIGQPFGVALAEWIGKQIALRVFTAAGNERLDSLGAGVVVMAPPEQHLLVEGGKLRLSSAPPLHSCRPSIDLLFQSIAADVGDGAVGCLLTGMGRDGAAGLYAMRRAGAVTLAQDEATSIIFGMPKEAIEIGAVDHVLPLPEIPNMLRRLSVLSTQEDPA